MRGWRELHWRRLRVPKPDQADYRVTGLDGLRGIVRSVSIPVYAIGGITLESIPAIKAAGAWGAAVISGILAAKDLLRWLGHLLRLGKMPSSF